jgi:hypothetical protein
MFVRSILMMVRLLAVLAVTTSLLLSPAASEEIELEAPAVELCTSLDADRADKPAEKDHSGHAHHDHACGSCHIHLLGTASPVLSGRALPPVKRAILPDAGPELVELAGLFRPPRI